MIDNSSLSNLTKQHVHTQKVLAVSVKATLKTIVQDIGDWPMKLGAEIHKHGLEMAGAPVYVYLDCDDSQVTPFTLQMCMPVADFANYKGNFETLELPEYTCVERLYQGSMPDLGSKGWAPFMDAVFAHNYSITNQAREVYLKWVDFASPLNQVLLQVGINPSK